MQPTGPPPTAHRYAPAHNTLTLGTRVSINTAVKDRNFFRVLEFSLSKTPNCRRPTVSFPLSCISTELVLVMVRGEGARESLVCVCVSVKDPDYTVS